MRDITEYLPQVGLVEPKRKLNARVTYSDPCHLAHAQGIRKQPRELLRAIGAELVEMPRPDTCCGSAGVYNVVQNEISMKILDEKMEYVAMRRARRSLRPRTWDACCNSPPESSAKE